MRIAIFTNNYLPNPYGVSMSIESFRNELEKQGHTVYIFAPQFKGYQDKNANVFRYPAVDVTFRGVRYPIAIPFSHRVGRILKNLEIDVVHSQHPNLLGWQAKRWAKQKKVPLVFTWHTLYDQYAHFVPIFSSRVAAWWAIGNAAAYANKCDQVVVPTPSVKNIVEKWGVKNPNIVVIASGVDESLYQDIDGKSIRVQHQIADNEILILLISRLTKEKNVSFLFEALMPLLEKDGRLRFLVGGQGAERNALEKIVARYGLEKRVIFTGIVPAATIKNYFAAADIFVHSSKSETQGMILTEAMYMGLPVVAVRAPGASDLVGNFVTGILVKENAQDFAAAVEKLSRDKELRQKFSNNAQKIARENYISSVCASKMLKVYEHVISKK